MAKKNLNMYTYDDTSEPFFKNKYIFQKNTFFPFLYDGYRLHPQPPGYIFPVQDVGMVEISSHLHRRDSAGPGVLEFFDHCSSYTNYYCITHAVLSQITRQYNTEIGLLRDLTYDASIGRGRIEEDSS